MNTNDRPTTRRRLSRRDFLTLALKTAAAGGLLAGCNSNQLVPVSTYNGTAATVEATPEPAATDTPFATATFEPAPTRTPHPTLTPLPDVATRQPEVVTHAPGGTSRLVRTRHAGDWEDGVLSTTALQEMVARSITALTGVEDAREAWQALFAPDERIAIKVNAFRNSIIWTHVPLVTVVTDALQDAGIPAENILIFDYLTSELEEAGFAVNRDGAGVRCFGTDREYTGGFRVVGSEIELSNCLLTCNALINMPVLKAHMLAGMTFALKNHYGTLRQPQFFHAGDRLNHGLPELNALSPIKDRTRLVIGDVLEANVRYANSWPYWEADYTGDTIMMSFDPVATDAVALEMLTGLMDEANVSHDFAVNTATPWLEYATEIGLGTHRLQEIELVDLELEAGAA